MKVLALLIVSVALLQSSLSEAAPYDDASFPQEEFAQAYPMDNIIDNRVLAEEDFEEDNGDKNSVDEIVNERQPNWTPRPEDKAKLDRLLEKWTAKPATDLVQHPATYASGTHHPATFASGHAGPPTAANGGLPAYTSGHSPTAHAAPFASGHAPAPAPMDHTVAKPIGEVLSIISFELGMPIDASIFKTKKISLEAAMAKILGIPIAELHASYENVEETNVDLDVDDVLVEVTSHKVKFTAEHKNSSPAAAKAAQAAIEAKAKTQAASGATIDGIAVPKQTPAMKVSEKAVKAPLKKSGVSSNSMPNFMALVVIALTSMFYL